MRPDPGVASRVTAEWDWVVNVSNRVLHAPRVWDDPDYSAQDAHGQTVCGYRGWLNIPGLFSRAKLPRCRTCCRIAGMPEGDGSPKNDDACRPVVETRLAALGPPYV
jgi:hypothetical protein